MDYQNKAIALDQLTASRANARAVGKGRDIQRLAADIRANGLIQPLTVFRANGAYEVDAGFRRFSALVMLAAAGDWTGPVPCRVIPASASETDREAISLAENMGQLPMHPLDRSRVLARFQARGWSAETIAARFGMEPIEVEKVLRLQRLALPIRLALTEGKLSEANAFALAEAIDRTAQMAVFERMSTWWKPADIRRAYSTRAKSPSEAMQTGHRLYRAIEAEYRAAGGTIEADLFTAEGAGKVDAQLVRRIAGERLIEVADKLRQDEGLEWSAAEINYARPGDAYFEWDGDDGNCPVPVGVVAYVVGSGEIRLDYPMIRSAEWDAYEAAQMAEVRAAEAAALTDPDDEDEDEPEDDVDEDGDDTAEPAAPALIHDPEAFPRAPSRSMDADCERAMTEAVGLALRGSFAIAFDALLASWVGSLRAEKLALAGRPQFFGGVGLPDDLQEEVNGAASAWALVDGWTEDRKREVFAAFVAAQARANTLDMGIPDRPKPTANALEVGQRLGVDMHESWSEADRLSYLSRMSKHDLATVVRGLRGGDAEAAQKLAKDEAVTAALSARWVPAYLAPLASATTAAESEPEADEPHEDENHEDEGDGHAYALAAE